MHPTQTPPPGFTPIPGPVLQSGSARRGLSAFFLSGLISAFLGAVLPAWRYHIEPNYLLICSYFLLQNFGMLLALPLADRFLRQRGVRFSLAAGAAIASIGFLLLAVFSPPAPVAGRWAGLLVLGAGWSALQLAVFHAVARAYVMHPAATLNLGGTLFGLGCLTSSLFVASTFFDWSVPVILLGLAIIPLVFAWLYTRLHLPVEPLEPARPAREALADFRNPTAILFALLLFFQFGNEGALAGWLALLLTQRLGISPSTALSLLALYWTALIVGRIGAQWLLPRVSHTRLLLGSVFIPMFACIILALTNNLFGAITGVLLAGSGFAVILPLVLEKIGHRFPYFHPGLFNGIFSVALTGGLLAPASVGLFAHFFGIGIVMGLPLIGSILVLLLVSLILLEAKLSSGRKPQAY